MESERKTDGENEKVREKEKKENERERERLREGGDAKRSSGKRVENGKFVSRASGADAGRGRWLRENTTPATVFLSGFTRRRLDVAMF